MAKQVDERVVRMQFDNAQFEQKMAKTMSSLQNFEKQLQMKDATQGLQTVQKAMDKVDTSHIISVADKVELKFSVMSAAVIHQVNRMVDAITDAGVKMAKSLTIDQVTSGFDKYTEKTEAVMTIMNATGKSVEDVNNALAKLQWFSDETSYSFVDMTSNVGKFTSAGVDLDVAVSAMQGIANAAADAGAKSTEASRAMYNFSQALAKGYVQLIDWKSIENANMATLTFKNTIVDTALELGTLKKQADGTIVTLNGNAVSATNFNDALKDAWFTNDVLLKALGKYSAYSDSIYKVSDAFDTCADAMAATREEGMELGARAFKAAQQARTFTDAVEATKDAVSSGWMRTFEIIFGNFNESVELWTDFTNALWDIFASGAEGRNEVLKGGLMSGWNKLVEVGITDTERLKEMIQAVGTEADTNLPQMIEEMGGFEKSLKYGWATADVLRESINRIANEIVTMDKAQLEAKGYTQDTITSFLELKKSIDDGTISLEEFADAMSKPSGRENLIDAVKNAFAGLAAIVEPIRDAIREVFPPITAETIYRMTVNIKEFTSQLKLSEEAAYALRVAVKLVLVPIKALWVAIKVGFAWATTLILVLFKLGDAFLTLLTKTNVLEKALRKVFGDDRYEKIATSWAKITSKLGDLFKNLGGYIMDGIGWLVDTGGPLAFKLLDSIYKFMKPAIDFILDGIVDIFDYLANFSFSDLWDSIKSGFNWLLKTFPFLETGFNYVSNAVGKFFGWFEGKTIVDVLNFIATGFKNIKTFAVMAFEAIDWKKIWDIIVEGAKKAGEAIKSFGEYVWTFAQRLTPAKILTYAFGTAIVWMLLSFTKVAKSATNLFDTISDAVKGFTAQFVPAKYAAIAASILILTGALIAFAAIDPNRLWGAIGAMGAVAGGLLAFSVVMTFLAKSISKNTDTLSAFNKMMLMLLAIAGTLLILAGACKLLDGMGWKTLGQVGLLAAGALAVLWGLYAIVKSISKNSKEFNLGIKNILTIAISLAVLVLALKGLAGMSFGEIVTGLVGLAGCVVLLNTIIKAIGGINGDKKALSGVLGAVAGLLLFVVAIKAFANLDLDTYMAGLAKIVPIMVLMKLLGIKVKDASTTTKGAMGYLLGLSAFMVVAKVVIESIADIPLGDLLKGTAVVAALELLTTYCIKMMSSVVTKEQKTKVTARAASTFTSMAFAIGVLATVVWALGKIDTGDLVKGVTAVGVMLLLLSNILKATKDAGKVAGSLLSLSAVIGTISATLGLFTLLKPDELLTATVSLSLAFVALSKLIEQIAKIDSKSAIASGVSMSVLMGVITAALFVLGKIDFVANLANAISLSAVIVAVGIASSKVKAIDWKSAIGSAVQMAAFVAVAIGGLVALDNWNSGGATRTIANAAALGLVVVALGAAIKLMNSADADKTNLKKLAVSIGGMAAFIALITGYMSAVMAIDNAGQHGVTDGKIISFSAALALAVLAVAASVKIMAEAKIQDRKAARLKQAVGAAMLLLLEVGVALAGLMAAVNWTGTDYPEILALTAALSAGVMAMAEATKIISTAKFEDVQWGEIGKILALMGGCLAEIGVVLGVMGALDVQNAIPNATALSEVLLAMSVAVAIMGHINVDEHILSLGGAMLLMMLGVAAVFAAMALTDYNAATQNTLALIAVLGLLTVMMVVFNKLDISVKDSATGAVAFDAVLVIVFGIIELLGAIVSETEKGKEWMDAGVAAIASLTEIIPMLLVLVGLTAILSGVGKLLGGAGGAASAGAGGGIAFTEVIAIVTAIITALGAIYEIPGIDKLVDNGVEFFKKIGDAIGGFVGSVVGSLVGETLKKSMEGLADGVAAIGDVGDALETLGSDQMSKALDNLGALAGVLVKLTGAEILDGLGKLFGGGDKTPLEDFGKQLEGLGPHLRTFLDNLSGMQVDDTAIDSAVKAAEGLAGVANGLYKDGGKWQDFTGHTTTLEEFGAMLPGFAENMLAFYKTLHGTGNEANFDPDFVTQSANAAEALAEVANGLYKHDGSWQDFTGETTTLLEFGAMLADPTGQSLAFADYMLAYYNTLSQGNFDSAFVTQSANAASALSEVANGLHKEGGLVGLITGDQISLEDLGYGVTKLGEGMLSFSDDMKDVSMANLESGLTAVEKFNAIAVSLSENTSAWEQVWNTSETDMLEKFGSAIRKLGAKLKAYYEYVSDIDPTTLDASVNAIDTIAAVCLAVSQKGLDGAGIVDDMLKELRDIPLKEISENFKTFDMSGAIVNLVNRISTNLQGTTAKNVLTTATKNLLTYVSDEALSNFVTTDGVSTALTDTLTEAFTNSGVSTKVSELIDALVNGFDGGIKEKFGGVEETITSTFGSVPGRIEGLFDIGSDGNSVPMSELGKTIINSFLRGLAINDYVARLYVDPAVQKMYLAFKNSLSVVQGTSGEESMVFRKIGAYIVNGIVTGLSSQVVTANPQIKTVCNLLLTEFQNALQIHSPSKVFRDEVGVWIIEGIAEGLKDCKSAEEAAEKAANNITSAFSNALKGLDVKDEKENLEYELWETLNPDATDAEKNLKKADMLETQIKRQSERVQAAQAEWQAMVESFGEESDQAQEAYNRYLQSNIDMANIAKDISDLRTSTLDDAQSAINDYYSNGQHDLDALLDAGYTVEDAWKMAAEELGYDSEALENAKKHSKSVADIFADNMVKDVEISIKDPVDDLESLIANMVQEAVETGVVDGAVSIDDAAIEEQITKALSSGTSGIDVASALADVYDVQLDSFDMSKYLDGSFDFSSMGFEIPDPTEEITGVIDSIKEQFTGGTMGILDNIIDGVLSKLDSWGIIGQDTARKYLNKFCEMFGISLGSGGEPSGASTTMTEVGSSAVNGLAQGIKASDSAVNTAVEEVATNAVSALGGVTQDVTSQMIDTNSAAFADGMTNAVQQTCDYINSSPYSQPVIRPVLDLSEVQSGLSNLRIGGQPIALSVDSVSNDFDNAQAYKRSNQNGSKTTKQPTSAQNVYNFNQTNTSPKALNSSEIFRQSKNLFSQLAFIQE